MVRETNVIHEERRNFARIREVLAVPNLIEVQLQSYRWFVEEGLRELFEDTMPIKDFNEKLVLEFVDYKLGEEKFDVLECKERDVNYAAPLRLTVRLLNKETGEVKEQEVFLGDFPLMTDKGTFIINGAERVIVSQLVRSPGVYFHQHHGEAGGKKTYGATVIPNRGAWLEFETDVNDIIYVRLDRTRKLPATTMLRAIGLPTNDDIITKFGESPFLDVTFERDTSTNEDEALIEIYKRLRPGEPPTVDSAKSLIESLYFDPRRYDLASVGRYKINKKLNYNDVPENFKCLTKEDIIRSFAYLLKLMDGEGTADDIDHLGNRRVRSVGELLQNQFRIGLARMERVIRERMTIQDAENVTPQNLINIRPVVAAIKEFFGSSQLSQFMDQTNPLAELTHKRRLSALGPGGLSRERAGFEVRDVHHSHYGRMCPIETPEGPNIGLIGSLGTYARVNRYGFIETPYRKVDQATGRVTDEIVFLTADEEDLYSVCQANAPLDDQGFFVTDNGMVVSRLGHDTVELPIASIKYMDVSPKQVVSVATALIPFLEHDDANRALMGSNMQRQAVPLIKAEAPLIGTGMEARAARDSGAVVVAKRAGEVRRVTGDSIEILAGGGDNKDVDRYRLIKYARSNQGTCFNQKPLVRKGDSISQGQVIADGPSTEKGELALGKNVLVAFMPWEGYNYEDAILLSRRVVRDDVFTSIHIEEYEVEARDTKLGPEEITRDIPNVGEEALKDLDEFGIIRVGAEVRPGDILVGKVTPKGETELTAEERLLRAIFGEKAREVRDTSLIVPHGESGQIVDVKVFARDSGHDLNPGVNQLVRVYIAQKRKISVGDKMAGRHGNKGVVSRIMPEEEMPFMPDGTPVDIVLNPLGVPSRMNIGQILETHLGWAAKVLGFRVATPVFDGARESDIWEQLGKADLPGNGKTRLRDGRTGEEFDHDITVGYVYMLKLAHLVDDKIHARSTGPYSLVTQQPLGGKAQFGGQRFGEMEVWALEAYGAAYTLQELLTVKSDDIVGRVKTYEAIVKGDNIPEPGVPESFKVLIKELQSLALDVKVLSEDDREIEIKELDEDVSQVAKELGLDIKGIDRPREDDIPRNFIITTEDIELGPQPELDETDEVEEHEDAGLDLSDSHDDDEVLI